MEQKNCLSCVYCKFIEFEKTDMIDVAIYQCKNKESKKYNKIIDRFTINDKTCNNHHFDPELT
jgi:hypothetical protein